MSTKYRDHGGPAFPVPGLSMNQATGEQIHHQTMESGMSLRDYFAIRAAVDDGTIPEVLATALAGPRPGDPMNRDPLADAQWMAAVRAKLRYIEADAMLAARKDRE